MDGALLSIGTSTELYGLPFVRDGTGLNHFVSRVDFFDQDCSPFKFPRLLFCNPRELVNVHVRNIYLSGSNANNYVDGSLLSNRIQEREIDRS
jgi:hypothetical protein